MGYCPETLPAGTVTDVRFCYLIVMDYTIQSAFLQAVSVQDPSKPNTFIRIAPPAILMNSVSESLYM